MGTKQMERPGSPTEKQTRKKHKQQQTVEKSKQPKTSGGKREKTRKTKKARLRIFPIWLRVIVVLVLAAAALVVGLMVGYGVVGNGHPFDALHKETWQHIVDIVKKEK